MQLGCIKWRRRVYAGIDGRSGTEDHTFVRTFAKSHKIKRSTKKPVSDDTLLRRTFFMSMSDLPIFLPVQFSPFGPSPPDPPIERFDPKSLSYKTKAPSPLRRIQNATRFCVAVDEARDTFDRRDPIDRTELAELQTLIGGCARATRPSSITHVSST